jgi:hypothetical protein
MHCKPIPCNENRVVPVKFSHREIPVMKTGVPAMRTGVPCNENRFFPVWKTSQGKPCSGPVLALYGIAVHTCGEKRARNGRTKVIYKGTFVSIQTLLITCEIAPLLRLWFVVDVQLIIRKGFSNPPGLYRQDYNKLYHNFSALFSSFL